MAGRCEERVGRTWGDRLSTFWALSSLPAAHVPAIGRARVCQYGQTGLSPAASTRARLGQQSENDEIGESRLHILITLRQGLHT